jgi:hypothetical protein
MRLEALKTIVLQDGRIGWMIRQERVAFAGLREIDSAPG